MGNLWFNPNGSRWSGFGLGSFDARYGNPTFIQDGKNGYLVSYGVRNEEDLVADMADKLVSVLENDLGVYAPDFLQDC